MVYLTEQDGRKIWPLGPVRCRLNGLHRTQPTNRSVKLSDGGTRVTASHLGSPFLIEKAGGLEFTVTGRILCGIQNGKTLKTS